MSKHTNSDKYFKWFLLFALFYFLGHFIVSVAHAQTAPSPTQPIIQCWNNGFGTIQCIQL